MLRATMLPRVPILRSLFFLPRRPLLPLARLASGSTRRPAPTTFRFFSRSAPSRLASPPPTPTSPSADLDKARSITERLKILIKSYGWYALGVYFVIGCVDFGISFAAIHLIGAEHVARFAHAAKAVVWTRLGWPVAEHQDDASVNAGGMEGLYAMIVLAWTVHKTVFLPVRVGLCAAVTPPLVRWLRMRGWAGGAGTRRAAQDMRNKMQEMRDARRVNN